MKVLISADTSCVVNHGVLEKNGINIFPLNVIVNGEEFLDSVTIDQETLMTDMRSNKIIKTSTPPLGQVIEYFENLFEQGYDHIIHFTISSKLSSMYNLFLNVANSNFEGRVTVIDSYSLTSSMLANVLYAKEEVEKGTPISEICAEIEKRKNDGYIFFIPENLTALRNGGRISAAAAVIGNTIGLKPVITLKDGELVKTGMTTSVKKAFIERIGKIKDIYKMDDYDYTLIEFDSKPAIYEAIFNNIASVFDGRNPIKGIIPINVCAHCGPGTIGLIVTPRINGKSLQEYL